MINGVTMNPNVMFFRTNPTNTNADLKGEIILKKSDLEKVSQDMAKKGFPVDTCKNYDAGKIAEYIKAINGIMPKDIKYNPKLNPNHVYQLCNRGTILQAWDKTTDQNVFTTSARSLYEA